MNILLILVLVSGLAQAQTKTNTNPTVSTPVGGTTNGDPGSTGGTGTTTTTSGGTFTKGSTKPTNSSQVGGVLPANVIPGNTNSTKKILRPVGQQTGDITNPAASTTNTNTVPVTNILKTDSTVAGKDSTNTVNPVTLVTSTAGANTTIPPKDSTTTVNPPVVTTTANTGTSAGKDSTATNNTGVVTPSTSTTGANTATTAKDSTNTSGAGTTVPATNTGTTGNTASTNGAANSTGSGTSTTDNGKGNVASDAVKACSDKAMQDVQALFQSDKYNMLARMFELTAMKLAERSLAQTPKATTLEELTHSKRKELQKAIDEEKGSGAFKDQVIGVYQKYQKSADVQKVNQDFDKFAKDNENACYWSKHTRLNNNDVSAYVLAVSASEPQSDLTELDAATIWAVESARANAAKTHSQYKIGSNDGNLLNMSTRVARYLGRIEGGRNAKDADSLKAEIKKEEDQMQQAVEDIKNDPAIRTAFEKCAALQLKAENKDPTCVDCLKGKVDSFEKDNITLEALKQGLLAVVSSSENAKMDQGLKMKVGTNTFDFSNFAKSTAGEAIPHDPPRNSQDACKPVPAKRKETLKKVGEAASNASKGGVPNAGNKKGESLFGVHVETFGVTCTIHISGVSATVKGKDGKEVRMVTVLNSSKQVVYQSSILDFGSCHTTEGCDNSIFGGLASKLESSCH